MWDQSLRLLQVFITVEQQFPILAFLRLLPLALVTTAARPVLAFPVLAFLGKSSLQGEPVHRSLT